MYIKFCRSYGEDKKDEASGNLSPESKLSVELEGGKGKQTEGNTRLYRAACLFLSIICLVLLVVVIILSVKLQTGSTVYTERMETTGPERRPLVPTCSHKECQAFFSHIPPQRLGYRQCAAGWHGFERWCFYLSTFRLSWDESQRNCTARGGALATVTSQRVQSFLTEKGNMNYWIGLRQKGATWVWVDSTTLTTSYWEEATSQGDCGILRTDKPPQKNWNKASCVAYAYFICQL